MKIFINGIDYTAYAVPGVNPLFTDPLNQPKEFAVSVYAADSSFVPVLEGQYVEVLNGATVLFSGYVTSTPALQIVAAGFAGYDVTAQSEEWLFDSAVYGNVPDFVNLPAGQILIQLIQLANQQSKLTYTGVANGPTLPRFSVQPSWTFSDAAYALAQQVGFRWYISGGIVYFLSQNDAAYGYSVNSSDPSFLSTNLTLAATSSPIINDITVVGPVAPEAIVNDNFLGDGSTRRFQLTQSFFGSTSSNVLFSDSFTSLGLNPAYWQYIGQGSSFTYGPRNITVQGGSQSFGGTALIAKNSVELGGELFFDSGSFQFNNLSVGILGGVYADPSLSQSSCVFGFNCSGNPVYTGIQPIINGVVQGTQIVTAPNHSYRLQAYLSADELYRYDAQFRSVTGQFGGSTIGSGAYITLVVVDSDLANPTAAAVTTVLFDGRVASIAPFGIYSLFNSTGMFFAASGPVAIRSLPPVRVRTANIGRVIGTSVNQDSITNIWTLQVSSTPQANDSITVTYRAPGVAATRLVNTANIAINGTKAAFINAANVQSPEIRNVTDCESLAQSVLSDHASLIYDGTYLQPGTVLSAIPMSGRYVNVSVPAITSTFSTIVSNVELSITDITNGVVNLTTTFGFGTLMASYVETSSAQTLTAEDFTTIPLFLPTLTSASEPSILDDQITVDAGRAPANTFEVRTSDSDWGGGSTANFIGSFVTESFSFARTSELNTFYLRELDAGASPKYSRYPVIITASTYPIQPAAPVSATVTVGSTIVCSMVLANTTDVSNIEIRASDNVTVIANNVYTDASDLTVSVPNTSDVRTVTAYFYTQNRRGDYSQPLEATGTLAAPLAPVISVVSIDAATVMLGLTTENRTDIIQEILEIDDVDNTFTHIIFTDSKNTQFSSAVFNAPAAGTFYARARKSDVLGFGPNTSPAFSFTLTSGTIDGSLPNPPTSFSVLSQSTVMGSDGTLQTSVELQWVASTSTNVSGYIIEYQINGASNWTYITTPLVTEAIINGLTAGTSYVAAIAAVNVLGKAGQFTTTINFTTPATATAPATPIGLTATGGFRLVGLSWTANTEPDLAGYLIEFSTDNTTWSVIDKTASTYYIDKGDATRGLLGIDTTYYYRVAAFNTSGQISSYSTSASATTTAINNNDIVADTINANVLLAGSVTASLLDVSGGASDIGNAINESLVKIQPGQILISGTTDLNAWISSVNTTKIAGGEIDTDSILASSLQISSRGLDQSGIVFSASGNQLSWTAGTIYVYDNSGVYSAWAISAGNVTWSSGSVFVYWVDGAASLSATTSITTAAGLGNVTLCVYTGGNNFFPTYGRTTITGDYIATGTITASNIAAGTITATQIAADTIAANNLVVGSRGFQFNNLVFSYDNATKNVVSWGNGGFSSPSPSVTYTDSTGAVVTVPVNSGSQVWTGGTLYFYILASSVTVPAPASYTITASTTPPGNSDIMLASFTGDGSLVVTYGAVMINGDHITAQSITAGNIAAGTITATQIAAGTITSNLISTAGLSVGGGSGMPGVFDVYNASGGVVGYVGGYTSSGLNPTSPYTVYGAWFQTLGVGGTASNPNLYADTSGNIWLIAGNIFKAVTTQDSSGASSDIGTLTLSAVTGAQANLVPDSAMQFPNPYWPLAAGMFIGSAGGLGTGNLLGMDCTTPTTIGQPVYFPVNPGTDITVSAIITANNMTAGYVLLGLDWNGRGGTVYELDVPAGSDAARVSKTFTVPAGVGAMRLYYGQWASSGNPAGTAYMTQPQIEAGSVMTAYRVNALDVFTGGLQSGIQVQEDSGSLSPTSIGLQHRYNRMAIPGANQLTGGNAITGTLSGYQSDLATIHDKSAVKNPQNLVVDDDFEAGASSVGHWSGSGTTFSVVSVSGQSFGHALQVIKITTGLDIEDGTGEFDFPVKGGEYLWVQFWLNSTSSTTGGSFGLVTGEGGSTTSSYVNPQWPGVPWSAATGWTFYSGWIQLDANACLARVYMVWHPAVNDTIQIAQLYIGRMRPTPVLSNVGSDGTTVTLGGTGFTNLTIGPNGTQYVNLTSGSGGYQVRHSIITAPTTGGYNDGETVNFSSLTEQDGAVLPNFGVAPTVALILFGPASGLTNLWASNVTTTGFSLNAKDQSAQNSSTNVTMTSVNGSSGTSTGSWSIPSGDTVTSVSFSFTVNTIKDENSYNHTPNQRGTAGFTVSGSVAGSADVSWQSTGSAYSGGLTINASIAGPTTLSLSVACQGNGTDVSSMLVGATAYWNDSSITGVTGVNFYAVISEDWSG